MTEDDTIRRLKRVPIKDLDPYYRANFWHFYNNPINFETWPDDNGWTESEYFAAGKAYTESLRAEDNTWTKRLETRETKFSKD